MSFIKLLEQTPLCTLRRLGICQWDKDCCQWDKDCSEWVRDSRGKNKSGVFVK